MKHRFLLVLIMGCSTVLFLAAWRVSYQPPLPDNSRALVVMRQATHRLLMLSGDSASTIRVHSTTPDHFSIDIAGAFSFRPDSMVAVFRQTLANAGLPSSYTVTVTDLHSKGAVYSFMVAGEGGNTIIPCLKREQPEGNYRIALSFTETERGRDFYYLAFGGFVLLLISGGTYTATRAGSRKAGALPLIAIGSYRFDPSKKLLLHSRQKTALSGKEAQLLALLCEHMNQVAGRNFLMQKLWEDEGVIVGRSLDVFISRLRKKLASDPSVQIENVHGVGYKLVAQGC